ncbi:MAG: zf-HC2 domain-containing protein [Bacteroidales bacterium]
MNCESCKSELEAYREGRLQEGMTLQVKAHLESCVECYTFFKFETLVEKIINEEKGLHPNPFIGTRVVEQLETMEKKINYPVYPKVLKPVFITASIFIAVFVGIIAGNLYQTPSANSQIPYEIRYIDDTSIESVELLAND